MFYGAFLLLLSVAFMRFPEYISFDWRWVWSFSYTRARPWSRLEPSSSTFASGPWCTGPFRRIGRERITRYGFIRKPANENRLAAWK